MEEAFLETNVTGDALAAARQSRAEPILDEFEHWLEKERTSVLPKSPIGKARRWGWDIPKNFVDNVAKGEQLTEEATSKE